MDVNIVSGLECIIETIPSNVFKNVNSLSGLTINGESLTSHAFKGVESNKDDM